MSTWTPDETLLGLIAHQRQHGYELLEHFRSPEALGEVWHLSTSQLYAVLKRLEKQGFIIGEQVHTENAPPRTEYILTDSGRAALMAWLNEPTPSASVRRVRVEFLSRLYIARLLNHPIKPLVECQRSMCQQHYAELMTYREQLAAGIGQMAIDFGIAQLSTVLSWIDQCEHWINSAQ